MNILRSFRKKLCSPVKFSCPTACLVDLCFDLEFSFTPCNLQITSDCRCWKADLCCQQHAKAEHMLHVWGTKGPATAVLDTCAGGCSKLRARDWWLVLRCLFPATLMLMLWWVLLECPRVGCPCCPPYLAMGSIAPQCAQAELLWECINLHMNYPTGVVGNCQGVLCAGSLQMSVQVMAGKEDTAVLSTEQGGSALWESFPDAISEDCLLITAF